MRLSALRLPLLCWWRIYFWCVVRGRARARMRREKARHCEERGDEAIQGRLRELLDCFASLAMTKRHPPPRVARGGTMRSMVEGACGAEAGREADAPST